jgi:predicted ATPase
MKTWIKTLETTDGYLRNAKIAFVEGLTCIIGARGTCKSTIVETLRFAHGVDAVRSGGLVQADSDPSSSHGVGDVVQSTLGSGTAVCTLGVLDEHGNA